MEKKFFDLIQISIGRKKGFSNAPTGNEWSILLDMAEKQSIAGLLFEGVKKVLSENHDNKPLAFFEWIGIAQQTEVISCHQLQKTKKLFDWFHKHGYNCCVLKGLGNAQLYPAPNVRQLGDIDIWIGDTTTQNKECMSVSTIRKNVVLIMRAEKIFVSYLDYVNCHAGFYNDIEVEVHFRPTYMFNPFANSKVQRWVYNNRREQMANYDEKVGFCYPTISFNLIFSLIHIFRHVFSEGIGLRQLTDYYFILIHSKEKERQQAIEALKSFGLLRFVGAIMYVMHRVYGLEESLMLCEVNEKQGKMVLSEILRGGNFGQYDDRLIYVDVQHRWKRGWENFKRDMRFIKDYPSEVMWMPLWKVWHYFWRMSKGYLD